MFKLAWTVALLAALTLPAFGQKEKADLNNDYRFPLSIGVEFDKHMQPSGALANDSAFDLAVTARYPLPHLALLQPALRLGWRSYDSMQGTDDTQYDHSELFATAGLVVAHKLTKALEAGLGLFGGYDHAIYPNLPGGGISPGLLLQAQGILAFNPFFNLNISVQPSLRYLKSFSSLTTYDGLVWGVGAGVNFRFGEDPDRAGAIIRSLKFGSPQMKPLFAAMQSYYMKNPVGSVSITNTDKAPVTNLQVSFFQAGYMDSPTPTALIEELAPGQSVTVEFPAVFNAEVFNTEGVTPLSGEIIATYQSRGRPGEQRQTVTYDLHDKTSLTWDDDRKVAAFITPADSVARSFASAVRQATKDTIVAGLSEPLQYAMQVYEAISALGIAYQTDPTAPFATMQESRLVVDSVSLARDTLQRPTGDCDDLSVLFCTILEAAGKETAFITTPGHIFAAVNTEVPGQQYAKVHPNRDMTLVVGEQLWVPVEITLMGRKGFLEAWRVGAEEYTRYNAQPQKRGFYRTREAQGEFRPVGLKQDPRTPPLSPAKDLEQAVRQDLRELSELILAPQREKAERDRSAPAYNKVGIAAAQLGRYDLAEAAFGKALSLESGHVAARMNLGALQFLQERYEAALKSFQELEKVLIKRQDKPHELATVLLNASKAAYALKDFGGAKGYYERAMALDAAVAAVFSYLASGSGEAEGRAAARVEDRILFLGTE